LVNEGSRAREVEVEVEVEGMRQATVDGSLIGGEAE
jgi:hypothetical protein